MGVRVAAPGLALVAAFAAAVLLAYGPGVGPGPSPAGLEPFAVEVTSSATPSFGSAPLLVSFNATVSFGVPTSFNWSFGDGTYLNGTDGHPTHEYARSGNFTATVTVWEGADSGSSSLPIQVVPGPLLVVVSATPTGGAVPLSVNFEGVITGGTGTYVHVGWSFGDGTSAAGSSAQHTYARAGHYYAILYVNDSRGATAQGGAWVNVSGAAAGAAGISLQGGLEWATAGFAGGVVAVLAAFSLRTWLARRDRSRAPSTFRGPLIPRPSPGGPSATDLSTPAPTTHPPSDPGPSAMASGDPLRLSQRAVVHLSGQGTLGPYDVAPFTLTQAGMSEALGVGQNALTNVLRRLTDAGVVEVDVRHVRGQSRRLKVYRLTSRGELLARDLRHRPPPGKAG